MQSRQVFAVQDTLCEICGELEVDMQILLHGHCNDRLAVFILEHCGFRGLIRFDFLFDLMQFPVAPRIHERCSQVTDHRGVGAAFRNQRFADVVDDVKIVMRQIADQYIRPVEAGKRNLFPRGELQTSMRAEMHQRIRAEFMTDPEIRGDVGVRGRLLDAVNNLVRIVADRGKSLRQNHDIAEPQHPERHALFAVFFHGEIIAGNGTVLFFHFRIEFLRHALADPGKILFRRNEFNSRSLNESLGRSLRIGSENGGVFLDFPVQLLRSLRQVTGCEPLTLQIFQRVQKRVADFQTGGIQRVLPGSLVVDDCDLLFRVRLALQINRLAHHRSKTFEPVRNHAKLHQPAPVRKKSGKHERNRTAVEFGHDDTLAEHSARHAALVAQILFIRLADFNRTVDRNVQAFQRCKHRIGIVHREASMRLIDNQRRLDRIQQSDAFHHAGNSDNVKTFAFKRIDKRFKVSAAIAGENADGRVFRIVFSQFFIERKILRIGCQLGLLILFRMKECGARKLFRRKNLFRKKELAVDHTARVVHQTLEIGFSAAAHVCLNLFGLFRRKRVEFRFRAGGGGDVERLFAADKLVNHRLLALVELEPHSEEVKDVVAFERGGIGFVVPSDRLDVDESADLLIQLRRQHVIRVIDHADAGRRHAVPAENTRGKGEENCSSGDKFFVLHFVFPSGT